MNMKRYKALLKKQAESGLTPEEQSELEEMETELDGEVTTDDDKKEDKKDTGTEEVELDEDAQKAIASAVAKQLQSTVSELVAKQVHDAVAATENTIKKGVNGGQVAADAVITAGADSIESMPKELRMLKQVQALVGKDWSTLKKFNQYAIDSSVKSNYGNTVTNADGGFLVPPADFIAEVLRLEVEYGVARRNATLYEVTSDSVQRNRKTGGVTMTETNQAAAKTGTKMTFGQSEVSLRKFAGIAPFTDELRDDAAVNFYNELTRDFAREAARIEDVLFFTDATTGILHLTGVKTYSFGTVMGDIDFDDLVSIVYKLNAAERMGAKFYLNDQILPILMKLRDTTTGAYIATGPMGGVPDRIWGYQYEVVEVMPSTTASNSPFIIFGNARNSYLEAKKGLDLTVLTEATVNDAGGASINLASQDETALRAVIRRNAHHPFSNAYVVGGTGTVS